jgi:hypothetical protein
MALTYTEIQSITEDYFKLDGKSATDIYFNTSFFMDYFMNKKKGIFERPNGGERIRVPLEYDEGEGGFYARGGPISSDDKATVNAAYFLWKHAYGNATIFDEDELKNSGEYAVVSLVAQKVANAQKTSTKKIASQIYNQDADGSVNISGLKSCCFAGTSTAYGGITPTDLVDSSGAYPWRGINTTTTEGISLAVIRTLATSAKIYDGPKGKPDVGLTTEALFNIISGILQVQQRFTEDKDTAKAGFTNLIFEQKLIAADDYCPSGYLFLLNSNFIGWAIHRDGYFARTPWADLITANVFARSMKIKWHGNLIVSNRKAHAGHNNLS